MTGSCERIARRAGVAIPPEDIVRILESLHFGVKRDGDLLTCTVPDFRQDITVGEADLCEEALRVYGYDHIQDNSPTLKGWRIEGDRFVLSFRDVKRFYVYNMDRSLKTGFEICGEDGEWKSADIQNFRVTKHKGKDQRLGELVGTDVVVSAKGVANPVRLRYLHSAPWLGALYNEVNLPVGAFHIGK